MSLVKVKINQSGVLPLLVVLLVALGVTGSVGIAIPVYQTQELKKIVNSPIVMPPAPVELAEEVKEVVLFETQTLNDATLASGQTRTTQEGSNGEKLVSYLVRYRGDKAVKRTKTGEKITLAAKPKIVRQGTKKTVAAPVVTTIKIIGDATCVSQTNQALDLLKTKAPSHYSTITKYIGAIECSESGSGMFAYLDPPTFKVGRATRDHSIVWYAGTIAHDAGHSRLYHDWKAAHTGQAVPNDVWTGTSAEKTCLRAQAEALEAMGAPQSDIDYVRNLENDPQYQNVPYEERWW